MAGESLAAHIQAAVDSRIAGKDPATDKAIYTTQDHATAAYARNPTCWAADLNLTGASPWNSTGGVLGAGTLVSPRHILFARHYQDKIAVGATVRFVAADGTAVDRTMTAKQNVAGGVGYQTDWTVGLLDSDVPASIAWYRVLPANLLDWVENPSPRIPVLALDQEEHACVTDQRQLNDFVGCVAPTDSQRLAFYESIVSGDSGNPAFWIIAGEPVLLTTWTFGPAGGGPSIHRRITEINSAMASLGGGYTLTTVDLSGFATLAEEEEPPPDEPDPPEEPDDPPPEPEPEPDLTPLTMNTYIQTIGLVTTPSTPGDLVGTFKLTRNDATITVRVLYGWDTRGQWEYLTPYDRTPITDPTQAAARFGGDLSAGVYGAANLGDLFATGVEMTLQLTSQRLILICSGEGISEADIPVVSEVLLGDKTAYATVSYTLVQEGIAGVQPPIVDLTFPADAIVMVASYGTYAQEFTFSSNELQAIADCYTGFYFPFADGLASSAEIIGTTIRLTGGDENWDGTDPTDFPRIITPGTPLDSAPVLAGVEGGGGGSDQSAVLDAIAALQTAALAAIAAKPTAAENAAQVRIELATELGRIDATVSSRASEANATANKDSVLAVIATMAAKFSGISSLANWLRAAWRSSTPDATAIGEINAGGGDFDSAAHSLQSLDAPIPELTGDPGPTPTPRQAIVLEYMKSRNDSHATKSGAAGTRDIRNDAGEVVLAADTAASSTSFSQGQLAEPDA